MKISIYNKMMFGFIAIIVIMVLSTSYVLFELHNVTGAAKMTLSANVKSVDQAKQLKTLLFDEEGYSRITGRKRNLIIRGGENIYPLEVERFLRM